MTAHWRKARVQGGDSFSLAKMLVVFSYWLSLLLGKEKFFLPPIGVCRVGVFLLGSVG